MHRELIGPSPSMKLLADVMRINHTQGVQMKFLKRFEKPTLDSVMHVSLASVLVAFVLVSTFPTLQAMVA